MNCNRVIESKYNSKQLEEKQFCLYISVSYRVCFCRLKSTLFNTNRGYYICYTYRVLYTGWCCNKLRILELLLLQGNYTCNTPWQTTCSCHLPLIAISLCLPGPLSDLCLFLHGPLSLSFSCIA